LFSRSGVFGFTLETSLRTDPPSSALLRRFTPGPARTRNPANGMFYSRILLDHANRQYFGYELLLERQ